MVGKALIQRSETWLSGVFQHDVHSGLKKDICSDLCRSLIQTAHFLFGDWGGCADDEVTFMGMGDIHYL